MARQTRRMDWSATPLGPIEGWPGSLRTAVDIMLASGHAMQLAWGPERTVLYNDAYAPMLGDHHPGALGLPLREAWPDTWEEIEPLVERAFAGETVRCEEMPVVMHRRGHPEETWWDFSYSPVRDETGAVAGLLNVTVDATPRVRAQRAERDRDEAHARLRENEARFRALVTAGAQTIYRMSPDWRVMHELDSTTLASTSGPLEDWPDTYILEEDRPAVLAAIDQAIRAKSVFELEHRVRMADGGVGWVLSRAVPLLSPGGDVVEWFGTAGDVTVRRKAEEALRESEARLRKVLEVETVGIVFFDFMGGVEGANNAFLAMVGHTRAELEAGKVRYERLTPPEWRWRDETTIAELRSSGRSGPFEKEYIRKNGSRLWILCAATMLDERTAVEFIIDTTDRKRAEAARYASEARLREMLDSIAEGFALLGTDFTILDVNEEAVRLNRRPRGELVGRSHWEAFPGSEQGAIGELLRRVMRERVAGSLEHRYAWPDGGASWLDARAYPTPDGGVAIFWRDVTDRKRTEAALRESEERFRLALDAADMGSFVWYPEEDRGEPDERMAALFGPDAARSFEVALSTFVHPGDRDRYAEAVARALDPAGDGILRDEIRVIRPGGEERWLAITGQTRFGTGRRRETRMAGIARDITARKMAEIELRRAEERQAFLLQLGDAMRAQSSATSIIEAAARLLGERLNASRVMFAEFDEARGIADIFFGWFADGARPFPAVMRLDEYKGTILNDLRAGRTVRVDDTGEPPFERPDLAAIAELGVKALLSIPFHVGGRLTVNLSVHQHAARRWTDDEVALVQEAAGRLWADLVRTRAEAALRGSEERFRAFAENSADTIWIASGDGARLDYLSPAFERMFGEDRAAVAADVRRWAELLHPDDREEAMRAMPRSLAGEMVVIQYRVVRPSDGRVVHLRDTGFPIRDEAAAVVRVAGIVQDVTDMVTAQEALQSEKERFRTLAEGIPPLVWRSLDEGRWTWASPQWRDYTGQSEEASQGLGWLEAVHPEDREGTMAAWHEAASRGRLDVEHRVRRASDGAWRWHQTRSVPVRTGPRPGKPVGRILEWLGTTTDIEDLKRLQEQQAVLVAELQHRTRNLLAVVRTVARKSVPPSPGRDEYDARLAALGRVQGFLARTGAYIVPLRDLVEAELQAVGNDVSERVVVGGPAIELPGEGSQPVALALHELATNAVKYGALAEANPGGRLSITWSIRDGEGGPRLLLAWREGGVAMPSGPTGRRGYGSELITRALPYQLKAETRLDFGPDGVRCDIALPAGVFRVAGEGM